VRLTCGKDCARWERRLLSDFVVGAHSLLWNWQLYTGSDGLFAMLQRSLTARASHRYESGREASFSASTDNRASSEGTRDKT